MQPPHYPDGNPPTNESIKFAPWWVQLNDALNSLQLCEALRIDAAQFYECGYTPKGAASQIARECGRAG